MYKRGLKRNSLKKILAIMLGLMYSFTLVDVKVEAATTGIINNTFKSWLDGWTVKGDTGAAGGKGNWGADDSYSLGYWSEEDYEVWTEQTITGLDNGYYRVEAYAASGGGQEANYLYANDFGGTGARTSIPVSDSFTKVVLNLEITNNQVTLGFYSKGRAKTWSNFDNISINKVNEGYKFLKGGDLTMVNYIEDQGGEYYDEEGQARDVFHILAEGGFNFVRLRTHNATGKEHGSTTNPSYYLPNGYQNTEDLLDLAKRAKDVNMQIEVTLNYSDWWPNATTQEIPSSWAKEIEGLNNDEVVDKLEELVYEYTKEVMEKLSDQGTVPEYISLGNEMQHGILYPYGKIGNFEQLARFLNAGYKAVKEVSTNTQVVLHLDEAGEDTRYNNLLDNCIKYGVNYDVIGASYYPFWTDKTVEDIIPWFNKIGNKYQKKILIMETGYNWNPTKPDGYPGQLSNNGPETHASSPQGQKEFLDELFNGIRNAEKNWIIGDLYWDPVMIDQEGVGWAMERGEAADGSQDKAGDNVVSNTTLFDFDGKALPSLKSFKDNTEGTTKGMISGLVVGQGGNKIVNANVTINVGGKEYKKVTDKYGRFFINEVEPSLNDSIVVSKAGYNNATGIVNVVAGEVSKVELVLGSGNVKGIIKDSNGQLIEGARVYSTIDGSKFATTTNVDGTYTLSDLPEGINYTIYAEKQGYKIASTTGVNVKNGESTNAVDFTLTVNSGTVSGIITDEEGNKLDGAKVVVAAVDGTAYTTTTDSEGTYNILYVLEGSNYTVKASKVGYFENSISGINVEIGKTVDNTNIELKKAFGSISGIAVDSNNNKVSGVAVTVSIKGEEKFTAVTDENGIFNIGNVVDNTNYELKCKKEGFGEVKLSNISVEPCKDTNLVLRMSTPMELENSNFDNGNLDGWTVEGDLSSVKAQDRTYFGDDAPSGKYALSLWADKSYLANIYQKIDGLKPGKYELAAWIYNGGDQNSATMYVKDGEEIKSLDLQATTGWVKMSLPVWIDNNSVNIGFDFDAKPGCWTVIDSIEFNYITSINYDGLELAIKDANGINKEEFTPKSLKILVDSLVEANEVLVNNTVTQQMVEEITINLNTAIEALVKKADKAALLAKVEEAKQLDETKYTVESWKELSDALAAAIIIAEDESIAQTEVDDMLLVLNKAIAELTILPEDNSGSDNNNENNNGNNNDSGSGNNTEESNDGAVDEDNKNNQGESSNIDNGSSSQTPSNGNNDDRQVVIASPNNNETSSNIEVNKKEEKNKLPKTGSPLDSITVIPFAMALMAVGSNLLRKKEDLSK